MTPLPLYPGLPEALAAVSGQLQVTLGKELEKYAVRLRRQGSRPNAKIIHDPVWRTIRLEPCEVVLLDSPLLQRLRRIRQLGLASYVFPGANYSRFEHSIGVLHQTQRIVESIRRNARSLAITKHLPQQEPISAGEELLLRMTALTHDVGHGFLSHVSERALSRLDTVDGTHSVRQFRKEAKEFFGVPALNAPPAVGEILSALSVLLPEAQEVFSLAQIPYWSDVSDLVREMAQLMCGGRDPKRPFLSEIISGPLDVDKLDYIPRDCYMAGVPMPVDVDRLMEKIQVVTVPASSIPEYPEESGVEPDQSVQVLAVQTSGSRAFEELVISRFLLYEKLYFHQKIRAMEGGIVNALEILAMEHDEFRKISTYLQVSDDEFLLEHWPGQCPSSKRLGTARALVGAVVDRNPLVRCYAFGPGLVNGSVLDQDSDEFRARWQKLKPKVDAKREDGWFEFRKEIADKARLYLRWIGQGVLADALADEQILVDLPPIQGIAEKTKFFVGDEQFGVAPFITRFRVERWAEAYETQHTIGYVYTMPEFAEAVYFAVRDLMLSDHQLSFDDASWTRTKLKSAKLREFSQRIAAKDTSHIPFLEPKFILDRRSFAERNEHKIEIIDKYVDVLGEVAERCKTFESHDGSKISVAGVRSWLLQFNAEEIPLAVRVLSALKFWGRSALSDAMAFSVAERFPKGFQALALGAPTASATHLAYLWDDVRNTLGVDLKVISSVSEVDSDLPIVIYDDNVGSGGQASTVFSQWFGKTEDHDLDERHAEALTGEEKKKLKQVPIFLVFATGFRAGLAKIEGRLSRLTENGGVTGLIIDPADLSCFRPAARVFSEPAEADRAASTFREAGRRALHDIATERNWSTDKWNGRMLGYGNAGGLTVFHYNVPTTTVSALWGTSRSKETEWTALFPRRPRKS